MGKNCPAETVCFHAQQCIEKYLKAFLVMKNIAFPKTHDIVSIVGLLPAMPILMSTDEQELLTGYAVTVRYPGDVEPSLTEARNAVKIARRVRKDIRALLPKRALLMSGKRSGGKRA
ncbi:MAG: HEPN domain-containing protein [Nitrospiraceae bacterium]|nr:HEPN domain-containing protein [Nitrospiraceae bacterium]